MIRRLDSIAARSARAALRAALALSLSSAAARAASVNPPSAKPSCSTRPPAAMLATAVDVESDSFHQYPGDRAKESALFKDGSTAAVEVTGCAGPVDTKMILTLPAKDAGEKDKPLAALVAYLTRHQDAYSKTPLGLPKPALALRQGAERTLHLQRGDRICLDGDAAAIVPSVQRCARTLTVSWARGAKKSLVFTALYQAP